MSIRTLTQLPIEGNKLILLRNTMKHLFTIIGLTCLLLCIASYGQAVVENKDDQRLVESGNGVVQAYLSHSEEGVWLMVRTNNYSPCQYVLAEIEVNVSGRQATRFVNLYPNKRSNDGWIYFEEKVSTSKITPSSSLQIKSALCMN